MRHLATRAADRRRQITMTQRVCLLTTLLLATADCAPSRTEEYVDRSNVPDGFVGKSYRAWLDERTIFIEVQQVPGLNLVFL